MKYETDISSPPKRDEIRHLSLVLRTDFKLEKVLQKRGKVAELTILNLFEETLPCS